MRKKIASLIFIVCILLIVALYQASAQNQPITTKQNINQLAKTAREEVGVVYADGGISNLDQSPQLIDAPVSSRVMQNQPPLPNVTPQPTGYPYPGVTPTPLPTSTPQASRTTLFLPLIVH